MPPKTDQRFYIVYWDKAADGYTHMETPAKIYNNEVFDDSESAGQRVKALQASDLGSRMQFSVYVDPLR
jgi:hypothetical protein